MDKRLLVATALLVLAIQYGSVNGNEGGDSGEEAWRPGRDDMDGGMFDDLFDEDNFDEGNFGEDIFDRLPPTNGSTAIDLGFLTMFPEAGMLFDDLAITDVMDFIGKGLNAPTIREAVDGACTETADLVDVLQELIEIPEEFDIITDTVDEVCDAVQSSPVVGVADQCEESMDAITDLIESWFGDYSYYGSSYSYSYSYSSYSESWSWGWGDSSSSSDYSSSSSDYSSSSSDYSSSSSDYSSSSSDYSSSSSDYSSSSYSDYSSYSSYNYTDWYDYGGYFYLPDFMHDLISQAFHIDIYNSSSICGGTRDFLETAVPTEDLIDRLILTLVNASMQLQYEICEHYYGNYSDYYPFGNYSYYGNYSQFGNYSFGNFSDYNSTYGNYSDYGNYSYGNYSDYPDYGDYSDYPDYGNYSDYFYGFDVHFLNVFWRIIKNATDFEEVCHNVQNVTEEASLNGNLGPLYNVTAEAKDILYYLLEDVDACVSAFEVVLDEAPWLFGFNVTGNTTAQICTFIVGSFDPTFNITMSEDLFDLEEEEEEEPLDFILPVIGMVGRAFNSETSEFALEAVCDYLPSDWLGDDFVAMCEAGKDENYDEYYEKCEEFFDFDFWDFWDYWDYWNYWDYDDDEFSRFQHYQEHFFWGMILDAFDSLDGHDTASLLYDPYSICRVVDDNLETSVDDIVDNDLHQLLAGAFKFLSREAYYSRWCYVDNSTSSVSSSSSEDTDEDINEFQSFGMTIIQLLMVFGEYDSPEELCEAIPANSLWEYHGGHHEDSFSSSSSSASSSSASSSSASSSSASSSSGSSEDEDDAADSFFNDMVDNLFLLIDEDSGCEQIVDVLMNADTVPFAEITGYEDAAGFCDFWSSALDGSFDLSTLDFPTNWTSLMPSDFAEPLLALVATATNNDTVVDALVTVCEWIGEPLGLLLGTNEVAQMCSAYAMAEDTRSSCETVLVPLLYGPNYPVSLKPLGPILESEFIPRLLDYFDLSVDPEHFEISDIDICPAIEDLLNRPTDIYGLVFGLAEELFDVFANDWLIAVCEEKEKVIQYLEHQESMNHWGSSSWSSSSESWSSESSSSYSWSSGSWGWGSSDWGAGSGGGFGDLLSLEELEAFIGYVTGLGSFDGMCDTLLEANQNDELAEWFEEVGDTAKTLWTVVPRCERLLESYQPWWEGLGGLGENIQEYALFLSGFEDGEALCEALVYYMTQEVVEVCRGTIDCAGVCNGDATEDCAGTCNGNADYDCAGDCSGSAFENDCDECVGGRTGRADDFGADRCGNCRKERGYREEWDCFGTCYGDAVYDRCKECVGGETNTTLDVNDDRLDCRGICDGGWVADTCGFCEPPSDQVYAGGSKYKDCSSTCITPGFPRGFENDCGECVGGVTGNDEDYGMNVCNQCESASYADESSCEGCDGEPNSGVEYDTCGVCGGDGTDCVGVGVVIPNVIPDTSVEIGVIGAGFTSGSDLTCIFTKSDGSEVEGEVIERTSNQYISCQADLTTARSFRDHHSHFFQRSDAVLLVAERSDRDGHESFELLTQDDDKGDWDVGVKRDDDLVSDIVAPIKVYPQITITSFSPNEITINSSTIGDYVFITATAEANDAFADLDGFDDTWDVNPLILAETQDGDIWRIPGDIQADNELLFTIALPEDSGRLDVQPTINGYHPFVLTNDPSYLTGYYIAPQVEFAKFTPEGAGLQIRFDIGVDYEGFDSCADLFDDVSLLGDSASCKWRSPKDLLVLTGKGENLVEIGDTLEIAADSIYAFRQDFGRASSGLITIDGPDVSLKPKAIVVGSPKLPSCGNVELDGRKSSGGGGRYLDFEWSVTSGGATSDITDELVALNSDLGVGVIEIDGDLMDADTQYVFSLTITNFLGGTDTTTFTVERSGTAAPEVKILPSIDTSYVLIADSFTLTAEVKFYPECVPAGATVFEWSCDNSEVPLNLKTLYSRTLFVDPNSLPGGENITFTVKVYKSSDPDTYQEQTVVATTIKSDLVAIIKGGREFTVGRDGGAIVIDGTASYDPDQEAREWEYEWTCTQVTDNSACYSYDPDHLGELIIADNNTDGAILAFDSSAFEADKSYEITLTAGKQDRSASATVYIDAINGDPPKVVLSELEDDGKVKDTDVIFLTAFVYSSSEIEGVKWSTVGNEDGYGFIDLTDANNLIVEPIIRDTPAGFQIAQIGIAGGVAERGTGYAILLNATTIDGQWGTAKAYITVRAGPTSCDFNVEDYEELTSTIVLTENCVAEDDSLPLSYQLFSENEEGVREAVTEQKSEPSFSTVGIPASNATDGSRKYIIKVCTKFGICTEYSYGVTVTEKTSFSEEEKTQYKSDQVDEFSFKGDYSTALGNLNLLADVEASESSSRRRRAAAESTSETATQQLELIVLTLEETVLTASSAQLLIDNTASLVISDMDLEDQYDLLGHYLLMIDVFEDAGEIVPDSSSNLILEKVGEISDGLDPTYNENVLTQCKAVQEKLLGSLTSDLVLGGGVTEVVDNDVTLGIQKTLLSGSFDSKTSGVDTVSIDFGSQLSSLYGAAWTCSTGSTCSGVTVKISHYNTDVDYYSNTQDDKDNRAADIIEIILADPENDETLNVTGLSSPVSINFPLTISQSNAEYLCVYWDTDNEAWSSADIDTSDSGDGDIECETTHLTVFTVLAVPNPTTTPQPETTTEDVVEASESLLDGWLLYVIIGIGAGILLLLFLIVIICLCKKGDKKRDGRVSPRWAEERGTELKEQPQQQLPPIIIQPTIILQAPPAQGGAPPPPGYSSQPGYSGQQPLPGYGNPGYGTSYDTASGIPAAPSYQAPPDKGSEAPNEYSEYIAAVTNNGTDYSKDKKGMTNVAL